MKLLRFTNLLTALAFVLVLASLADAHSLAFNDTAQPHPPTNAWDPDTVAGTVHAVTIDDAVHGTPSRHVELELDDGTLVPLTGDRTQTLASGDRVRVVGHRAGKRIDVDSVEALGSASATPETNAEVEGTLAILHLDDFEHGKSSFVYEVHPSQGKTKRLRLGALPGALAPGMRIRVAGHAEPDGEDIAPQNITILAEPTSATESTTTIAKAATTNSVLVILANFNNTAVPAYSVAQAQQVMTTNVNSVANFFREASYGQQLLNVTVTPSWVRMDLAQPASCSSTDWQNIGVGAETASRALGAAYDPASYKFVVYLFPKVPACGWLGLAYIGSPHKAWINGPSAFVTQAVSHEMGHNFGLLHAASLDCGAATIGGSCTTSEYGDPFDTMGNQRAMHYNAVQKAKLGWIAAGNVQTYSGGSATYTLTPLELAGGATYAVKIPTSSSKRTYWLEFRQPIGFDSPLSAYPNNGAQIRVSSPFETYCSGCDSYSDDTELIDTTPGTAAFTDATLVAGNTFSDAAYGINIKVLSASASGMTVQVSNGASAPPAPTPTTTALSTSANPAFVNASVMFTAAVAGSSPTGTVLFSADGTALAGCSAVTLSGGRATCSTRALAVGTHAIVAKYSGNSTNAASTSAPLTEVVKVASINVALASNGATASASTTRSAGYSASYAIDNRRSGAIWGASGGWNDNTLQTFPDWLQVNFNGTKTIDRVVVYSVQDDVQNPVEPTDAMTFTRFGVTSFDVLAWNGAGWIRLASVRGNTLVKRSVSFPPYATSRIRINILASADGRWSRITEVEAWEN